MADTIQFELVSPERQIASVAAQEVLIPGADGDMTAMAEHAPVITTLRPGILRVVHAGGTDEYVVSGGFAEVTSGNVSVLAEKAMARGDITQQIFDGMLAEAQSASDSAKEATDNEPGAVDEAAKLLADMIAMGGEIGLGGGN